mgnify:CR=1 FL=1
MGRFEKWSDWAWMLISKERRDMLLISQKDAKKLEHPIVPDALVSVEQLKDLRDKIVEGEIHVHEGNWIFRSFRNGADEINCNFRHFATKEQTKAWEQGAAGKKLSED